MFKKYHVLDCLKDSFYMANDTVVEIDNISNSCFEVHITDLDTEMLNKSNYKIFVVCTDYETPEDVLKEK